MGTCVVRFAVSRRASGLTGRLLYKLSETSRVRLPRPLSRPREPRPAKEPGQQRVKPALRVNEDRVAGPDACSVLPLVQVSHLASTRPLTVPRTRHNGNLPKSAYHSP
jgi:hypothetical protein